MESVVLDIPAERRPPAPAPRAEALGPTAFLRILARNPREALIRRVVVVKDAAAIDRVLLKNCDNYEKNARAVSAGRQLANDLPPAPYLNARFVVPRST
jgi:hypothetical protein